MINSHPFLGPRIKLERSLALVRELQDVSEEYFKKCDIGIYVEPDKTTGVRSAIVRVGLAPPTFANVLIGEILYHLRSTLDQLAVALIRLSKPGSSLKDIYFPSGKTIDLFNKSVDKNLSGIDPRLISAVKNLNVYKGGNDLLYSVFPLSIVDKHLDIVPYTMKGNISLLSNFIVENADIGFVLGADGSLVDGIVLSVLGEHGTIRPRSPNSQVEMRGELVFGNVDVCDGKPIIQTLHDMMHEVVAVHNALHPVCIECGLFKE